MQRYGLIGRALSHSFSKEHFAHKFQQEGLPDHRYDLFELSEMTEFPAFLQRHHDLRGLNVTVPYKQSIIPYLSSLDPLAAAVGAVNTIDIRDGQLIGHNTDVHGFRHMIQPVLGSLQDRAATSVRGHWYWAVAGRAVRWPSCCARPASGSAW